MSSCSGPNEDATDYVIFGFDAAHCGDMIPGMFRYPTANIGNAIGAYRDFAYMKEQCESLAGQIAALLMEER